MYVKVKALNREHLEYDENVTKQQSCAVQPGQSLDKSFQIAKDRQKFQKAGIDTYEPSENCSIVEFGEEKQELKQVEEVKQQIQSAITDNIKTMYKELKKA